MSIRLQVLLDEKELREIKELALQEHLTVSAWVRRAIIHEKRERPAASVKKKIEVLENAMNYTFPTGDYTDMAAEVESGYLEGFDT